MLLNILKKDCLIKNNFKYDTLSKGDKDRLRSASVNSDFDCKIVNCNII